MMNNRHDNKPSNLRRLATRGGRALLVVMVVFIMLQIHALLKNELNSSLRSMTQQFDKLNELNVTSMNSSSSLVHVHVHVLDEIKTNDDHDHDSVADEKDVVIIDGQPIIKKIKNIEEGSSFNDHSQDDTSHHAATSTTTSNTTTTNTATATTRVIDHRVRKNRVVLFGPHDRYNFGDLLFSKVLDKLLQTRAGYSPQDVLIGGGITVNMTRYGGFPDVTSIKTIQQMSRSDRVYGPYDIVYIGGEAIGCNHECLQRMLPNEKQRDIAKKEKIYDCGYLIPKSLLLPTEAEDDETIPNEGGATSSASSITTTQQAATMKNYAIANSIGGFAIATCKAALDTSDYKVYRDKNPAVPDSAVMTKELFHDDTIANAAKEVLRELSPDGTHRSTGDDENLPRQKYIAVQHKMKDMVNPSELAAGLDEVSRNSGAMIVFFAAGTVPGHDSFDFYHSIASYMTQPNIVYEAENTWKVIGLISQAEAVLSTSLHVRIMSFIYFKPRITWAIPGGVKHPKFISMWDANNAPLVVKSYAETWSVLKDYFGPDPKITQDETKHAYEKAVKRYLESFDLWSNMLAQGNDSAVADIDKMFVNKRP